MRRFNLHLVLAAMDSIIDRVEGKVQGGRIETMNEAEKALLEGVEALAKIADTQAEKDFAETVKNQIIELANGIKVDLVNAIENNAPQEEFTRLDDVIDANGEGMDENLGKYEDSVKQELNEF